VEIAPGAGIYLGEEGALPPCVLVSPLDSLW
jgi:hypothetical protein